METARVRKTRASSSDEARRYRQQGHFESDAFFRVMNGMGDLLMNCIKSFPSTYEEY